MGDDVGGVGSTAGEPTRRRSRAPRGGTVRHLLAALGCCLVASGMAGCVIGDGRPDDPAASAVPAPPDGGRGEPTEGGAGEPPAPTAEGGAGEPPEPPGADGGVGGPGEPVPRLTPEERAACHGVPLTDDAALAVLEERTAADTEDVAPLFDSAAQQVTASISALPPGAVRDAAIGYRAALETVRNALEAGDRPSVARLSAAEQALADVCDRE